MPGNESIFWLVGWFGFLLFFCLFFGYWLLCFYVFFVLFGFWFFEIGFLCVDWRLSWSVDQAGLDSQRYDCLCLPSSGIKDCREPPGGTGGPAVWRYTSPYLA